MISIPVHDLIPVLQVAIGPVILISGVGLLLLTLTNRFGRAVDRSRSLGRELREVNETQRQGLSSQVEILYRRAQVIRLSIIMAALSLLLAAVLIIVLFVSALIRWEAGFIIVLLFICCLVSLIVSLIAFIRDIQLSLHALRLELGPKVKG
jgi:multidrug efflux pump subunit AcrB